MNNLERLVGVMEIQRTINAEEADEVDKLTPEDLCSANAAQS